MLAAVTWSVYVPATWSGLHSDDWGLSYPGRLSSVLASFHGHWHGGGEGIFYRPLSRVFIHFEARLFGYSGFAQHVISYMLFIASAFLVAWRVRECRGPLAGCLAAGFILLNPMNSEAVSWIASQTDLLVGFFMVSTFFVVLRPLESIGWGRVVGAALLATLTYLSKDSSAYLGPLFVVYAAAYLHVYSCRRCLNHRPLLVLIISQIILWLVYLLLRKVFLGSIAPPHGDTVPRFGRLWHWMMILYTTLREYVGYLVGWFQENKTFLDYGPPMVWLALLIGLFLWVLYAQQRYVLLGLALAFLVTLIPMLTSRHSYFYSLPLTGTRRFFYNGNFIVGAFLALLVVPRRNNAHRLLAASPLVLFVALLVFLNFASRTSHNAVQWRRAGDIRDQIKAEIASQMPPAGNAVLVVNSLPDHVEEAYVFRVAFTEFVGIHWPKARVIKSEDLEPGKILPGVKYLRCEDTAGKKPYITEFTEISSIARNLELASNAKARKVPFVFDFDKKNYPRIQIVSNADIRVLDEKTNPLLIEIVGGDPYITFPWPSGAFPAAYKTFRIRYEFLDPGKYAGQKDFVQFMWKGPSEDLSNLPLLTEHLEIDAGVHEVKFDISKNLRWLDKDALEWVRIDLGNTYREKIRIHEIALE